MNTIGTGSGTGSDCDRASLSPGMLPPIDDENAAKQTNCGQEQSNKTDRMHGIAIGGVDQDIIDVDIVDNAEQDIHYLLIDKVAKQKIDQDIIDLDLVDIVDIIPGQSDAVTEQDIQDLLSGIGDMALDQQITLEQSDAVWKLKTFFTVLKRLPHEMANIDRHNIIAALKSETLDKIPENINVNDIPYQCLNVSGEDVITEILNKLSIKCKHSFENFLVPPTKNCMKCGKALTKNV